MLEYNFADVPTPPAEDIDVVTEDDSEDDEEGTEVEDLGDDSPDEEPE